MVEVQPTSSASTSSTALAAPSNLGLTNVQVAINNLSENLQSLSHTVQLNAFVASSTTPNSIDLTTALGTLTVSLTQQLGATEKQNLIQILLNLMQNEKPITLTLQAGSPPTQGSFLVPTSALTLASAALKQNQNTGLSALQNPTAAVGDELIAIVLPATPQSSSAQPAAPEISSLFTKTPLSAPLSNPTPVSPLPETPEFAVPPSPLASSLEAEQSLPSSAPQNLASTIPIASPAPQSGVAINPLATTTSLILQPGNEVSLRINTVVPTSLSGVVLPPSLAPNQILATVTGTGTNGQLILKAGDATLFVKTPITAPLGTDLILTVALAKNTSVPLPIPETGNFQTLPQLIAALNDLSPQILQQVMATHIPQPTESLGGALLFLFSAFKQGNVRGWLGSEAADSLIYAGKDMLLKSLSRELGNSGQVTQDNVVGEWRSYPIPLFAHQQFQSLMLYVHSDRNARKDEADRNTIGKVRFLIDMTLSKLGVMQIDGFVQPKKLDMILRSEAILPPGLHQELRDAYLKALNAVGYTGVLNFQVGRQHWMIMNNPASRGITT